MKAEAANGIVSAKDKNQQNSPFKKAQPGLVGLAKEDLQQVHLKSLLVPRDAAGVLIGSNAIIDSY